MAKAKVVLDERRVLEDGTYPLKIYLSHKRKSAYIYLDISLRLDQWVNDAIVNHPKQKVLNISVNKKLSDIQSDILDLELKGEINHLDLNQLVSVLKGEKQENKTLVKYVFDKLIDNANTKATQLQYRTTFRWIGTFYNVDNLEFNDITVGWLKSFELKLSKKCSVNSIANYLKNIRVAYNYAIDHNIISLEKYPFRRFKIKTEKTKKRNLTAEQLIEFINAPCRKNEVKYRDFFMLIFYLVGINIKDLLFLTEIRNGRIEYKRAKTGRLYSIKVEPEALEIINKYRGENYLVDPMDTNVDYQSFASVMNRGLKKIGKKDGKELDFLTTYYARHSWATIASKIGVSKDVIAAALGHGGNTVTDIYIDFDESKIDEANRKVIDYVLKKGGYLEEG